jgi:uncharacterized membrane protein YjgN (DUF898 family)
MFYWLALGVIQQGIVLAHNTRLTWAEGIFVLAMVCEIRLFFNFHELTEHQVAGIVQSALVLCACHFGFGKSATHLQPDKVEQAKKARLPQQICTLSIGQALSDIVQFYYLSNLLYVLVLGLIKCSASLWVVKLTVNNLGSLRQASRQRRLTFYGISALIAIWTIASIVVLALPCHSNDTCMGTVMLSHTSNALSHSLTDRCARCRAGEA